MNKLSQGMLFLSLMASTVYAQASQDRLFLVCGHKFSPKADVTFPIDSTSFDVLESFDEYANIGPLVVERLNQGWSHPQRPYQVVTTKSNHQVTRRGGLFQRSTTELIYSSVSSNRSIIVDADQAPLNHKSQIYDYSQFRVNYDVIANAISAEHYGPSKSFDVQYSRKSIASDVEPHHCYITPIL